MGKLPPQLAKYKFKKGGTRAKAKGRKGGKKSGSKKK